ncbi:MAG TPA: zf-HC2 domain-containing protein [Thermoanaerobaculia bacterium]
MEHTQALEMHAPDRYVLGQLSAAEADAFEEHYFDCPACADDVRLGMSIMEGGRLLVQQGAEPPARAVPMAPVVPIDTGRRRFMKWIPAAAAAALLTANLPLLMRTQSAIPALSPVVGATTYFHGAARSEERPVPVELPEGTTAVLAFDVRPPRAYPRYEARVLRGNDVVTAAPLDPTSFQDSVKILLPDPGPGTYVLKVVGIEASGNEVEITGYGFEVRRPAVNK